MRHRLASALLAALSFSALAFVPNDAAACGGTFCDGTPGPLQMPVDQTGENILFVVDGTSVEAHIQIQYKGDAPHFAWVIPLQRPPQNDPLPTFAVGSQLLFGDLLNGTVPTYGYQPISSCQNGGAFGAGTGGSGGGFGTGGGGGGPGGPTIVYAATVGSFDVTLLQGGTVDSVMQWLGDNGYQQPPEAMPILEKYLTKSYLFAALKLTNGVGVDQIHPLVVTYTGARACVPLELTAIAATEDMPVRTFFLGSGRVAPTNYMDVELNDAQIDWINEGANYNDVVTRAVDSPVANGHAFVTEYAGTSSVVSTFDVYSSSWNGAAFPGLDPTMVISVLQQQGLVSCSGGGSCQFNHPLIEGLLHEFLPVPAGIDEAAFYGCLDCYKDKIDLTAWDGAKFGAAMIERIIQPGKHAQDIVQHNPYLTRLFTTISPAEMTEDPDFVQRMDLPDVSSNHLATLTTDCDNCQMAALPTQQAVGLKGSSFTWPTWTADMPYARVIRQVPETGPVVTLVDNGSAIDGLIATWNADHTCAPSMGGTGGAPTGTGGSGGSGVVGGVGGQNAAGGMTSSQGGAGTHGGSPGHGGAQGGTPGHGGTSAAGGNGAEGGAGGHAGTTSTGAGGAPGVSTPDSAVPADASGGGCQAGAGRETSWSAAAIGLFVVLSRLVRRRRGRGER